MSTHSRFLALTALGISLFPAAPLFAQASQALISPGPVPIHGLGLALSTHPTLSTRFQTRLSLAVPPAVDLSAYNPAVGNQGPVGSCASWAIGYYLRGWYAKRYGAYPTGPDAAGGLSAMYLYSQVRVLDANGNEAGSYLEDNLATEASQGIDSRNDYSQGDTNWRATPTTNEMTNAGNYKVSSYQESYNSSLSLQDWIQQSMAGGDPVALAIPVYSNFYYANSGTGVIDAESGTYFGGHALFASKYDANGVWVENQWGTGWGHAGWIELGWNFINNYAYFAVNEVPASPFQLIVPTASPTQTPTNTATTVPSDTPTATNSATPSATISATVTDSPTATATPSPTVVNTKTAVPNNTPTTFDASPTATDIAWDLSAHDVYPTDVPDASSTKLPSSALAPRRHNAKPQAKHPSIHKLVVKIDRLLTIKNLHRAPLRKSVPTVKVASHKTLKPHVTRTTRGNYFW